MIFGYQDILTGSGYDQLGVSPYWCMDSIVTNSLARNSRQQKFRILIDSPAEKKLYRALHLAMHGDNERAVYYFCFHTSVGILQFNGSPAAGAKVGVVNAVEQRRSMFLLIEAAIQRGCPRGSTYSPYLSVDALSADRRCVSKVVEMKWRA